MFLILTLIVLVAALNIISGPDHAGEGQVERHRDPAHHGRDARRDHARLPHHGRARSASSARSRASALGLLITLNVKGIQRALFPARLGPDRALPRRAPGRGEHPTRSPWWSSPRDGPVAARDALSLLAGGPARSGPGAALRLSRLARRGSTPERPPSVLRGSSAATAGRRRPRDPARRRPRDLAGRDGGPGRAVRAPASRRCSTSPACWRGRTAARSIVGGQPDRRHGDAERTRLRREEIGFVYQFHHLLPEFSALENVVHAADHPRALAAREAPARATELLTFLGLGERLDAPAGRAVRRRAAARRDRPRRRQRARACCSPTSRPATSTRRPSGHVFGTLISLVRASGLAALIATHNLELAARMDRRVTIRDGLIEQLP